MLTGARTGATTAGTVAIDFHGNLYQLTAEEGCLRIECHRWEGPMLTARFWRSRRAAAIAGIVFAVLLITAMTMMRIALGEDSLESLQTDASRRTLIRARPQPRAVRRHRLPVVHRRRPRAARREVEDRLFSTVFLGSGLLFLAMLFRARLPRPA